MANGATGPRQEIDSNRYFQ